MISDMMTTQVLKKKFKNNFDLCNFAINIGRNSILSGKQSTLREIIQEVDDRAEQLSKNG